MHSKIESPNQLPTSNPSFACIISKPFGVSSSAGSFSCDFQKPTARAFGVMRVLLAFTSAWDVASLVLSGSLAWAKGPDAYNEALLSALRLAR